MTGGPQGERCSKCYFWEKGELNLYSEEDREGECHRSAPPTTPPYISEILTHLTLISWSSAAAEQREKEFSSWEECMDLPCFWPITYAHGWCGEWRRKMKKSKAPADKTRKVMKEYAAGKLHSGSKTGPVVKSRKQAVAIALSEARKKRLSKAAV